MKKEIVIFIVAYIVATIIRGLIFLYTGFSFNIFQDRFGLIPFLGDVMIWALSYIGVRLVIINLAVKRIKSS
ncbi:hypothetical protein J0B03_10555 [Alkalibacter rhizosphaerae]|uniref:Uncharacterized protein n=1 Tax=Alkalibacter rhizosphaerae TaxID=2815577 RepID=A0A974XE77_9FIRM|nr:hypothetical protein [Alkalibacter rhizosphaerae]QSX08222.1 hypothetical protein J0B03_10555 [Alkalibacter rhizosphaerae]